MVAVVVAEALRKPLVVTVPAVMAWKEVILFIPIKHNVVESDGTYDLLIWHQICYLMFMLVIERIRKIYICKVLLISLVVDLMLAKTLKTQEHNFLFLPEIIILQVENNRKVK